MTAQQLFDYLTFVSENGFDLCELTLTGSCFVFDNDDTNGINLEFDIKTVGIQGDKLFLFDKDSKFL